MVLCTYEGFYGGTYMSISKHLKAKQAKEEIETLLIKRQNNEFLRNECGKILNDLGKMHGYDVSNQIITDLNLSEKLNIKTYCPVIKQ